MSIIAKCDYCVPVENDKRTYRKQTEVYDAIGIDVPMCWSCGEVALFERQRIIKLLESIETYPNGWDYDDPFSSVIALIKGENE